MCVYIIVLKTGPDRPVRPVQSGTESQSGPVKTPKTGQEPVNNRKTGQKPVKNRGWTENFQKNGSMPGSVFKTMIMTP